MSKRILLCSAIAFLLAACANGWPYLHNAPKALANSCTPSGSKIARNGCGTSTPGGQTSGEELDRNQQVRSPGYQKPSPFPP